MAIIPHIYVHFKLKNGRKTPKKLKKNKIKKIKNNGGLYTELYGILLFTTYTFICLHRRIKPMKLKAFSALLFPML